LIKGERERKKKEKGYENRRREGKENHVNFYKYFGFFRVINLQGHFEALNNIFM